MIDVFFLLILWFQLASSFLNQHKLSDKNKRSIIFLTNENQPNSIVKQIEEVILNQLNENESKQLFIGLVGPPGSGKSTISSQLILSLKKYNATILPMDGYHYTKNQLNNFKDPKEAFKRRGSHWTFDSKSFVNAIENLRLNGVGSFPSFDHAIGDPIENDIIIGKHNKIVIIEGNYLLLNLEPWNKIKEYLDIKVFLNCNEKILRERIVNRHIKVGCTPEEAVIRFETNDLLNAREILANSDLKSTYRLDF